MRRSRDRGSQRDVIRESSWDSAMESKKTPPDSKDGANKSQRSQGSAYDKYNLAEGDPKKKQ